MDSYGRTSAAVEEHPSGGHALTDILKDLSASVRELVRSEISAAKNELAGEARKARGPAFTLMSGGVLAIFAAGFLLLAIMLALAIALPNWLAALIVAALSAIGASIGIARGRQRLKTLRTSQPVRL